MAPRWKFPWDLALAGSGKDPSRLRADVERCLEDARRRGDPFFLNVNIEETSVARLDISLGEVLDALEAAGRAGDTVVVLLSDNGMSFPFAKATVYRNGTWSPVLLRHPGLTGGAVHEELVSSVDVMPTLLELLDVAPPPDMDGRSWGPLLRGEAQEGRDVVVTHVNTVRSGQSFPQRCVRTRTRSLIFQPWADGRTRFRAEPMHSRSYHALVRAARSDERITVRLRQYARGVRLAFYDLEHDPDERRNLIDAPEARPEIEHLHTMLLEHMERTGDPLREDFRRALAAWRLESASAAHVRSGDAQ